MKTLLSSGLAKSYELGPGKVQVITMPNFLSAKNLLISSETFVDNDQVIAGIVKRMDKGASIENINA